MNRVIPLLAFSVLLLVPLGIHESFANHPAVCPFGGSLNTISDLVVFGTTNSNFCIATGNPPPPSCPVNYSTMTLDSISFSGITQSICGALPAVPTTTSGQCLNNAILQSNHCVPDFPNICSTGTMQAGFTCIAEAMGSMIGGTLLETNTIPLLVGAIGVNPVITGLVGITIAGIAGQAAWFIHRKKRSQKS